MLILDSSLVMLESLDDDSLLTFIQELGRHGRVRHKDGNDNSPNAAQSTNDEKLVSPRGQGPSDVADSVPEEPAQGYSGSVGCIPQSNSQRLFSSSVPLTSVSLLALRLGSIFTAKDSP